jgi:hypothetical protein
MQLEHPELRRADLRRFFHVPFLRSTPAQSTESGQIHVESGVLPDNGGRRPRLSCYCLHR